MRATIKISVMAFLAAAALGGGVAYGQGAVPQRSELDGSRPAPTSSAGLPLEIGDKLKISFYETIDLETNKQNGRDGAGLQGALRTFYQRMDLSGDYAVEQDGAISIPLLGRFQAEGRAPDDVRADLAGSFMVVIGRSANIDVKIFDRSPIYVVGPVKNPGAYKYVAGMIVLHAIALAGGLDRSEGNLSGLVEGAREMERLHNATLQVKQLLARRARLEAERDGASALPTPIELSSLTDDTTTRTLLGTESTILRVEQVMRRQQEKLSVSKVAAARNESEALKRKLDQIDAQTDMRLERLDDMQKLKDRGLVTSNNVLLLRTELSDLAARRQDYVVAVVQAAGRLAEAEGASARLSLENTAEVVKAIATVDQEIAAAHEAIISANALARILYRPEKGTLQAGTYAIVRQSKGGARTLQATETSPLMPGDVLKVNFDAPDASPGSRPQPEPALPYGHTAGKAYVPTANKAYVHAASRCGDVGCRRFQTGGRQPTVTLTPVVNIVN